VRQLPVTASIVHSSPIRVTLMKEALSFSEKSVLTRAIWRKIPEDDILRSHRRENLKSYNTIFSSHILHVQKTERDKNRANIEAIRTKNTAI
jgi:hypothetical protein